MSLILATRGLARRFTPPEAPPGGAVTPTASWNFDELAGSVADDAQNVQDGTYNNGVALGALPMLADAGTAIALKDGASARVAHNAAFEVSLWTLGVYAMAAVLPAVGETMGIFSKVPTSGHANEVSCEFINTGGQLRIRAYTTTDAGVASWIVSNQGVGDLTVGQSYTVAIVQRSTGASLYIDAQEFGPNAVTDGLEGNNGPLVFGGYLHASQGLLIPLNGCVDDARFHATALTVQEIEALPVAQDTLHLVDWAENIDEGTGSIDPAPHAWPESGWTVGTVTDDSLSSPPTVDLTADGVLADYETTSVEENTSASVTIQITKGLLNSTATVSLTVIDAGAGGGSGQALSVPSLADFLVSDEAGDTPDIFAKASATGTGSGTSEANAMSLSSALSAVSAGQVIQYSCATPGTVEFFDSQTGITLPNGSAGNFTTIQAKNGDGVVISAGEDFSGARTISNGFWTQSGLSQADIDKHIWRSTSTFSTPSQMFGWWIEFGHPQMIIQAQSMTQLRAPYGTDDSFDNYAGPCAHMDTDGRVYLRFQRPHAGKYSFNNKWSNTLWPNNPEAVVGGQIVYPISQDPNDYAIYLTRLFDGTNGEFAFRPSSASGGFIKIGSGINSYGFEQVTRGHDITMRRGLHWSWRRGLALGSDTNPLRNFDCQRARFTCGARYHLSRSEWKFGGPLENLRDAFLLGGAIGDGGGNLNFKDCTIADFHELLTLGNNTIPVSEIRWRNCTIYGIYDDGIQAVCHLSRVEVGYCFLLNSAYGGSGQGGDESDDPNPGGWFIHHNVVDNRAQRNTHWRAEPHAHFLSGFHSTDGQQPRKYYNNLFIWGVDSEQEAHPGLAHSASNGNSETCTTAVAHEVFNNIVIRHDTQRYDPLAGAAYSDLGATDRSDMVCGRFHHYSGASNCFYDYNLYYRDVPEVPGGGFANPLIMDMEASKGATRFSYASMAAWKASAQFTASKLAGSQRGAYPDGIEGNSTDTKPTLATIDDFPTSRFQYRPSATSAVTVAASGSLSGEDWWTTPPTWGDDYFSWSSGGGTLEPDSFKGALEPNGSTLPVGVQNR